LNETKNSKVTISLSLLMYSLILFGSGLSLVVDVMSLRILHRVEVVPIICTLVTGCIYYLYVTCGAVKRTFLFYDFCRNLKQIFCIHKYEDISLSLEKDFPERYICESESYGGLVYEGLCSTKTLRCEKCDRLKKRLYMREYD